MMAELAAPEARPVMSTMPMASEAAKALMASAAQVGVNALVGPGGEGTVGEVGVEEFARIALGWRWAYEGFGWGEGAGR